MREQLSQKISQQEKSNSSSSYRNNSNPEAPINRCSSMASNGSSKEEKVILEAMSNQISVLGGENAKLKSQNESMLKKLGQLEQSMAAKKLLLTEIVSQIYQKQGPSLQETLDVFEKNELQTLQSYKSKTISELQDLLEVLFHKNNFT